jgi:hypothetical protein
MRSPHSFSAGKALRMSGGRRRNKDGEDEGNTYDFGSLRFTLWGAADQKNLIENGREDFVLK